MRIFLMILVTCVTVLLAGCAQVAQKAVEQATGIQTSQDGNSVTIKGSDGESVTIQSKDGDTITIQGKDGEAVTISSQLPDELKEFPVPAGFKLDSGGSMRSSGDDKLLVATWIGQGTHQAVAQFYQQTLPERGWQELSSLTSEDGSFLSFRRGDQDEITITTSQEGDNLTISVMLGNASPITAAAAGRGDSQSADGAPGSSVPAPGRTSLSSELPPEMNDVPIPSGFEVVEDGAIRAGEGDNFTMATVTLAGKLGANEVGKFYEQELTAKGWAQRQLVEGDGGLMGVFENEQTKLTLTLQASETDKGTQLTLMLTKS